MKIRVLTVLMMFSMFFTVPTYAYTGLSVGPNGLASHVDNNEQTGDFVGRGILRCYYTIGPMYVHSVDLYGLQTNSGKGSASGYVRLIGEDGQADEYPYYIAGASPTLEKIDTSATDYKVVQVCITQHSGQSFAAGITEIGLNGQIEPPDLEAPAPPAGLTGEVGDGKITLTWTPNTEPDLRGYYIYRDGVQVFFTTNTTFTQVGLNNGQTYTYGVRAVDLDGNLSTMVTIQLTPTPPPPDTTPPATPTGLVASPGDGRVTLYWKANSEPDLDGYFIYVNGQKVGKWPIKAITYTVTGLKNGQTYKFAISAVDKSGNESPRTEEVEGTPEKPVYIPAPEPPTGLQGTGGYKSVSLTWNESAGALGYFVYQGGKKVNFTPITETQIQIENLTAGEYSFYVTAVNANGIESKRSEIIKVSVYDYVPILSGKNDVGKLIVAWDAIPEATEYLVYRNGILITTTTETSYTDTDVVKGEIYTYEVSAVVGGKEYDRSKPVNLRPGDYISIPDPGSVGGGGGGSRIFDSILDVIKTGFSFVSKYNTWIMIVLAVIFAPVAAAFVIWLFRKVRQPKTTKERELRERQEREAREREARELREREEREDREREARELRAVSYMTRTPRPQRRIRRGRS